LRNEEFSELAMFLRRFIRLQVKGISWLFLASWQTPALGADELPEGLSR
jgi:hypothetical protein